MALGKLDSYMQKNEIRSLPNAIHKDKLKMDYSHEIKRHLLLGRKAMIDLDSILKIRDITLPTNVRMVKATVFSSSHLWM